MSEPRMRARPKGSQFATTDLEALLMAFGTHQPVLPETIRILDEIITDYIIESAHLSTVPSVLAHRSKIKIDDFKFALRKDPKKLGRVTELLQMDKDIKKRRRAFEVEEGEVVQGVGRGKGKRGRKRKVDIVDAKEEGSEDGDGEGEGENDGRSRKSGRSGGGGRGGGAKRGRKKKRVEAASSE